MRKTAIFFFMLLILSSQAFAAEDGILELYRKNVFALWNDTAGSGGVAGCIGFYWKEDVLATSVSNGIVTRSFMLAAGHCPRPYIRFEEYMYQKPELLFRELELDKGRDMLLASMTDYRPFRTYFKELKRNLEENEVLYLAKDRPEWGKDIEIQEAKFLKEKDGWLIISVDDKAIEDGVSGAPVITRNGELVGTVIRKWRVSHFIGFIMPVSEINKVFEEKKDFLDAREY